MKALHSSFFIFLFIFSIFLLPLSFAIPSVAKDYRRILHEPLFQGTSTPPSDFQSPPSTPATPDQPFFPEVPSTPYQSQSSPSPPSPSSAASNDGVPISTDTQPGKPGRKVAIAISVGIVTLGMLSALAFFLYRHKMKHTSETQKLVNGGVDGGSQRFQEDARPPSSSFLYIGTVEPRRESASESNGGSNGAVNASPYRKLNSVKRSDRYRPSPELQPLPPLSRPPPSANSPSAYSPSPSHSSSDEESRGTAFYTPHGSTISSDAGYYTPFARPLNNNDHSVGSVIHSKKNSPRFTTGGAAVGTAVSSSPEMKHVIIPSIKQKSPLQPTSQQGPQNNRQELSYSSNGPKFSPPPPPQNMAALQAIYQDKPPHRTQAPPSPPPFPPRAAPPPPPPPPPPPLQKRREDFQLNVSGSEVTTSSTSNELLKKPELRTPNPKSKHVEEVDSKSVGSSEKTKDTETDSGRPKLKPLHWDKVRASSDRATVWDQLKSSSFPLNEDRMEHLFGCNSTNSAPRETVRRSVLPPIENENRVLDPKKSQNIAILLRALNVTTEEVSETLLDGNTESLGVELLETLVKMAPTKEEEIKLREYSGDASKLGTAEKFLKTILDIPFAFKRVEAMLYRANFDAEVKYLRNSFQTLEDASKELKNSRLFLKLLEAVLRTGNRMNVGTNRGDATAFKLDTLLKLVDVKGTDGKTTLLHFVVQEITISEVMPTDSTSESLQSKEVHLKEEHFRKKGLQLVTGLSKDLSNVKRAAGMDFDVLSSYVSKLETGLEKVRSVIQLEKIGTKQGKFFDSMKKFLKEAEEESCKVKGDERMALSLVKEVTEYFHGDAAKEEAHPLRIFTVVRDFLGILDNVCKEVKSIQDRTVMGSARSSLPVLNRYNVRQDRSSDP